MPQEERPVHLVVDCSPSPPPVFNEDGELVPADVPPRVTAVPLTDAEWAEQRQRSAEHDAVAQAAEQEHAKLAAAAAQHPDPLVRALARHAGILP